MKNVSFASRTPSCTACIEITWTCVAWLFLLHITIIKKIYCSSVYFTVYIYYCEWEQETDDLERRKTWRQLELHVSPTRANSHEKKRSVGKELWPSVFLTEASTAQLKVIADALTHSHTYPISTLLFGA